MSNLIYFKYVIEYLKLSETVNSPLDKAKALTMYLKSGGILTNNVDTSDFKRGKSIYNNNFSMNVENKNYKLYQINLN